MKNNLKIILSIIIVFSLFVGCGSSATPTVMSEESAPPPNATSSVPLDTLMVGVQEMSGDFISGFGNNAYDLSVKVLVGGYMSTHEIDAAGEIILNTTVVENLDTATDDLGNKTFTFTLHDDIYWNNGDPITARDYVASLMWFSSPQWTEAGASTSGYDAVIGYTEYFEGTTDVFSGVQLISDSQFSLTVSAENFPYYWEALHATVGPIHFDTYLPHCEIISDQSGTKLSFSQDDLITNCLRISETERYAPTVTCGPYSFVSFENQTVTLELNEHFKGDMYGNKPTLQYIVQKAIPLETDVEWVISGEIDIVEGVVEKEKIEAAKASDATYAQSYARSGFGYLAMLCDTGVTADVNVRWAMASLVDRAAVVDYVLGGYGSTVDAEYGIGQWMYHERGADLSSELMPISFSIAAANGHLDKTQWVYEADGTTPFDPAKADADGSYMRHNAQGEMLSINHLGQSDNVLTDIIEIQYAANAPLAGIKFNLDKSDWNAVLDNYYNAYKLPTDDRVYDTFNLATNFTAVFDRYYTWHSDFVGTSLNKAQLSDPELDELIVAMRSTAPSDTEAFLDAWFDYQVRWNELMPQVPLYSNEFYDIAHVYVDNLNTSAYAGYENLICQISKSEK